MKISIIVPVYNGSKYLDNTISSLLTQAYTDIELILVNDGSTDNSREICEKYQLLDNRIILINQINRGISSARNAGLEIASGDYISFIDQDDMINDNIFEILMSGFNSDVDLVVSGKVMKLIDDNDELINEIYYVYKDANYKKSDEMFKLIMNVNRDMCLLHLWNCLYRRAIIVDHNIRFNTSFRFGHEDSLFNIQYFSHCKSVQLKSGIVYYYSRRTKTSTSLKMNMNYISDFKLYSEITKVSLIDNLNKETNKNILYTYLIRLGISLFKQYSCGDNFAKRGELDTIIELCQIISESKRISSIGIGLLYSTYLKLITILKKRGLLNLAISILEKTNNL